MTKTKRYAFSGVVPVVGKTYKVTVFAGADIEFISTLTMADWGKVVDPHSGDEDNLVDSIIHMEFANGVTISSGWELDVVLEESA